MCKTFKNRTETQFLAVLIYKYTKIIKTKHDNSPSFTQVHYTYTGKHNTYISYLTCTCTNLPELSSFKSVGQVNAGDPLPPFLYLLLLLLLLLLFY